MKAKKIAVRGFIILAVTVALCMFFSETIRTIATPKVKLTQPRQGKLSQSVRVTGKLTFTESVEQFIEGAEGATGITVKNIMVAVGQQVNKGDTIFEAEINDYQKSMDTLKEQYATADAALQALEQKNINLKRTDIEWAEAYSERVKARDAELEARLKLETLLKLENTEHDADGKLPEGASEALKTAAADLLNATEVLTAAQARLAVAERYPVTDETRSYITDKTKHELELSRIEADMLSLRLLTERLTAVKAPKDCYITKINVKKGEAYDVSNPAYEICSLDVSPVMRADITDTTLTMSKGMAVSFEGRNGRYVEGKISVVGENIDGTRYIDIALTESMLKNMGGVYAATLREPEITVEYRANRATTLLPSSAVRGDGDNKYVYSVRNENNKFGAKRMVTYKVDVKVLAEADGITSVEEDLSYMQIAYMEDRAISDNTSVMTYMD